MRLTNIYRRALLGSTLAVPVGNLIRLVREAESRNASTL